MFTRNLLVQNLAGLEGSPLVPLEIDGKTSQDAQKSQGLHTHLLALVHLGFSSPAEENGDILGHLRGCRWGAILVL